MPVLFPAVVTGASGFVGRELMALLPPGVQAFALGPPGWRTRIEQASFAAATVFHLAARVHAASGAEDEYMEDNAHKTRALAERAAAGGARAFVFVSTIKVNGEETHGTPFRPGDAPRPEDAYARSKLAAERALLDIAARTPLRVAIVRAPLVYGAHARGNLAALLRLADSPWPLPFGALDQPRSFIHVRDLCSLLVSCAAHESARGVFLAAHREPIRTAALVRTVRRELGRPARLFALPPAVLEGAAAMAGQGGRMRRLTRALEVDATATEQALGWRAAIGIEEAVGEMVRAYRAPRA
jgi:UDP-glucose 4-epimerase